MIVAVADTRLPDDQDDGLSFDTSDVNAFTIREEDQYSGVRVSLGHACRLRRCGSTSMSTLVIRSGLDHR